MKLTLKERLVLISVLPVKGAFEELIVLQDIKDKIKVTQEDVEKANFKTNEKGVTWEEGKIEDLLVEFTKLEAEAVEKAFGELSDKKELHEEQVPLFKNFKNLTFK